MTQKAKSKRADGRKSLLVYFDPDVIKRLKKVALDEDKPAYEIAEMAVREWLAIRKNNRSRNSSDHG